MHRVGAQSPRNSVNGVEMCSSLLFQWTRNITSVQKGLMFNVHIKTHYLLARQTLPILFLKYI